MGKLFILKKAANKGRFAKCVQVCFRENGIKINEFQTADEATISVERSSVNQMEPT